MQTLNHSTINKLKDSKTPIPKIQRFKILNIQDLENSNIQTLKDLITISIIYPPY